MDAPERIWAEPSKYPGEWTATAENITVFDVEYIRADFVEARIADAVKAEREACAAVADEWAKDAEVEAEKPGYRATSRMSKLDYAYKFRRIADGIRARGDQ